MVSDNREATNAAMVGGMILGAILATLASGALTAYISQQNSASWKAEAIRRGYAEYSPQTGIWHWKTPPGAEAESGAK